MQNKTFTILDLETTGGSPYFNRIIEIGFLRVEKGEVVQTFNSLVNPGIPLPEIITEITGLTDSDLADAPVFDDLKEELAENLEGTILVAHNAGFDYGFLEAEFQRHGWGFAMDSLCTVRLSRVLFPEFKHHNLDALIERFGFSIKNRHRALDDAKILWDFLQLLPEKFPQDQVDKALSRTMQKISPKQQRRMSAKPKNELTYIYEE
jgi:DNA polymerase-3 subunit epsilon